MNKSVDPCDNFYEFTCGRWEETHEIPAFSPMWNRLLMFQALVSHRLKSNYNEIIVRVNYNNTIKMASLQEFSRSHLKPQIFYLYDKQKSFIVLA